MNYSRPAPPQGTLQIPLVSTPAVSVAERRIAACSQPPASISVASPSIQLSLVIPTYNERDNIARIVEQLTDLLDGYMPGRYELIVVDDNSPESYLGGCPITHPNLSSLAGDAQAA